MTRIALLADIHSNLPALEAVLADFSPNDVDAIVVAGDVVNWGPFSAQVMERLTALRPALIRGNNELYLLDLDTPRAPAHWKNYTIPPWTLTQLGAHWLNVIATWPDTLTLRFPDAPTLRIVHGSPRSHFEPIFPLSTEDELAPILHGVEENTIVAAHTHLAMDRQVGRWHILNPGSVGVPLDGIRSASYMLLKSDKSGWHAELRRVPFDYAPIFAEFARLNFVDSCGPTAQLVIEEYKTARLAVHPFNEWHKANFPGEPSTFAMLEQFAIVDKWRYTPPAYHVNLDADGT